VEGIDAANKIAILTAVAFGLRADVDRVYREGITRVSAEDIRYADKMGYVIKLLAIAKRGEDDEVELRVHPAFLPKAHPLASVNGVFNAIFVRGDACDDVMLYGRGAGSLPTGSAVAGDAISSARNILHGAAGRVPCTCSGSAKIKPIEDVETSVCIRMRVADKPGVMGTIATIFGQEGVSIQSVIQEASISDQVAEIVWVVHKSPEKRLRNALARVEALDIVESIPSIIRVEG
jgi:homoserine dehydrogenase